MWFCTANYCKSKMQHFLMEPLLNAVLFFFFPSNQIFIFENNIYYCAHVGKQAIRVVSTGKEGVIFNGLSDWLYEGRTRRLGQQLVMSLSYALDLQNWLELDVQHCISGDWWTTELKICYSNSCLKCWTGNNVK